MNAPRILHADDSRLIRTLVRHVLRDYAGQLDSVADGCEAFAELVVAPSRYALLITDHNMPGMTGLQLVRKVRTLPFSGAIAVFSAGVTECERDEFSDLGVQVIIEKGPSLDPLLDIARRVMGVKPAMGFPVPGAADTAPSAARLFTRAKSFFTGLRNINKYRRIISRFSVESSQASASRPKPMTSPE